MPSRVKQLTGPAIQRRIKDGRGQGDGSNYKPWLYTTDVPSRGTSVQCWGPKSGRTHHLLSQGEYHYFLILTYAPCVVDIREQFPLHQPDTLLIAEALGYRHPANQGNPVVMTTDFLVTVQNDADRILIARTYKKKQDLHGTRLFQKLEIERRFWEDRGVNWGIVTDADIAENMWRNVEWMFDCWNIEQLRPMTLAQVQTVATVLITKIQKHPLVTLSLLCESCDQLLGHLPGTALKVTRFLFANRVYQTDINVRICTSQPVTIHVFPQNLPWS